MSILIKGMKMPTSCRACLYSRTDIRNVDWCVLTEKDLPCDCPLVPVPPHGRLIDADALAEHKFVCIPHVSINGKDAGTAYRLGWNTAIEAVMENAETIIGGE